MKKLYGSYLMITLVILIFTITGCEKDNNNPIPSADTTVQNISISGYVQKGPFINGSSVTVYDLNSDLSPTGKSYNVQITDNSGSFKLDSVTLTSDYISLRADGFYFNEVTGRQSGAQITLYALSKVKEKGEININVLTDLEKARVEYLMKGGKSFVEAKAQAQREILAIFDIQKDDSLTSEDLNISQSGDDNGILLAISSIIQGYRSEGEMSELLANMSNDIKEDGILNDSTLGSALLSQAKLLDTSSIKANLAGRYGEIGLSANVPEFGKYISDFIAKTKFVATQSAIIYPETGLYGENILSLTKTEYSAGADIYYSLAAEPAKGTSLMIRITSLSSDTSATTPAYWGYAVGSGINWLISEFDYNDHSQTCTAINSGQPCDLKMQFDAGTFLIEYFETNSGVATRSKTIGVH